MSKENVVPCGEILDCFDEDDDLVKIEETFNSNLPTAHIHNLTKLFSKFKMAPIGKVFGVPFNKGKTLINYARLDYCDSGVKFEGKFNAVHEIILNSVYSFYRNNSMMFTARNILQHIFGNVPDHFQSELVGQIEKCIDELRHMQISMDLKDKFGRTAVIKFHGEKYRPLEIKESLLDLTSLKLKSGKNGREVNVYKINRLSPIFKYAEKLKQLASWQTKFMKVPVRKNFQNVLLCNYYLTRIALIKNPNNKYTNKGILFSTVHKDLNLNVSDRRKIKTIRDNSRKMFDYWVATGLIKSYTFEKQGTKFYKIVLNVDVEKKLLPCPKKTSSTSTHTRKVTSKKKLKKAATSVPSAETAQVKMVRALNSSRDNPSGTNVSNAVPPAT